MDIAAYVDTIIGLLIKAGVPKDEIKAKNTEVLLVGAFAKGRDFHFAVRSACKIHNIEI